LWEPYSFHPKIDQKNLRIGPLKKAGRPAGRAFTKNRLFARFLGPFNLDFFAKKNLLSARVRNSRRTMRLLFIRGDRKWVGPQGQNDRGHWTQMYGPRTGAWQWFWPKAWRLKRFLGINVSGLWIEQFARAIMDYQRARAFRYGTASDWTIWGSQCFAWRRGRPKTSISSHLLADPRLETVD